MDAGLRQQVVNAFTLAAAETFSSMIGVKVIRAEPSPPLEDASFNHLQDVYSPSLQASVSLRTSADTGLVIAGRFLGEEASVYDPSVLDALRELFTIAVNAGCASLTALKMKSGIALSMLSGEGLLQRRGKDASYIILLILEGLGAIQLEVAFSGTA
ncbi:MAG: hypothetical protein RL095_2780 [Verrucomicrobiota bacterium]|jgi:CheY-specific phosphatase CheX